MIKVLTETEYKFLKEFIALIEKYNLLFTTDEKGEIEVTVHRQQLATETNQNSDLLHTPIHLGDCFDETELNYILDQTDERIKQIAEEYQSEEIFTQHLSKNNKSNLYINTPPSLFYPHGLFLFIRKGSSLLK